jgi:hypothetical protein
MTNPNPLHPGDPFPALTVALPGRRALRLPGDLAGRFGVLLFYCGPWVPGLQRPRQPARPDSAHASAHPMITMHSQPVAAANRHRRIGIWPMAEELS